MAVTTIGSGFTIDPTKSRAAAEAVPESDEVLSPEVELLQAVAKRLTQGFPAAAMAAAVELVNTIAATHDLGGGAYL